MSLEVTYNYFKKFEGRPLIDYKLMYTRGIVPHYDGIYVEGGISTERFEKLIQKCYKKLVSLGISVEKETFIAGTLTSQGTEFEEEIIALLYNIILTDRLEFME